MIQNCTSCCPLQGQQRQWNIEINFFLFRREMSTLLRQILELQRNILCGASFRLVNDPSRDWPTLIDVPGYDSRPSIFSFQRKNCLSYTDDIPDADDALADNVQSPSLAPPFEDEAQPPPSKSKMRPCHSRMRTGHSRMRLGHSKMRFGLARRSLGHCRMDWLWAL